MKKTVYLAKFGKVYGPITEAEAQALHSSGKILEFSWIWDGNARAWQALDPAPAPLTEGEWADRVPSPVETKPLAQVIPMPIVTTGPSPTDLGFELAKGAEVPVIGYNARQLISGTIAQFTSVGCEFKTQDQSYSPTFVVRAPIILNLLEPKSGKLMNVTARVSGVVRKPDGWIYQVRWDERTNLARQTG